MGVQPATRLADPTAGMAAPARGVESRPGLAPGARRVELLGPRHASYLRHRT